MPSPRIAQRCVKFHRALVTWERDLFLTRFAAAGVVTECAQMAGSCRRHLPATDIPVYVCYREASTSAGDAEATFGTTLVPVRAKPKGSPAETDPDCHPLRANRTDS